jgi:hypothetical protein
MRARVGRRVAVPGASASARSRRRRYGRMREPMRGGSLSKRWAGRVRQWLCLRGGTHGRRGPIRPRQLRLPVLTWHSGGSRWGADRRNRCRRRNRRRSLSERQPESTVPRRVRTLSLRCRTWAEEQQGRGICKVRLAPCVVAGRTELVIVTSQVQCRTAGCAQHDRARAEHVAVERARRRGLRLYLHELEPEVAKVVRGRRARRRHRAPATRALRAWWGCACARPWDRNRRRARRAVAAEADESEVADARRWHEAASEAGPSGRRAALAREVCGLYAGVRAQRRALLRVAPAACAWAALCAACGCVVVRRRSAVQPKATESLGRKAFGRRAVRVSRACKAQRVLNGA